MALSDGSCILLQKGWRSSFRFAGIDLHIENWGGGGVSLQISEHNDLNYATTKASTAMKSIVGSLLIRAGG